MSVPRLRVVPGLIPPYEDSIMNFVCTCCGKKVSTDTKAPACDCGGLFELDFVPPAWDDSKIDRDTWSLFRYRAFMALEGDAWKEVTMGEGMDAPVIPFYRRRPALEGVGLLHADLVLPGPAGRQRSSPT